MMPLRHGRRAIAEKITAITAALHALVVPVFQAAHYPRCERIEESQEPHDANRLNLSTLQGKSSWLASFLGLLKDTVPGASAFNTP
jgi:hypothetical protein